MVRAGILSMMLGVMAVSAWAGETREQIQEKITKANYCQTNDDCMEAYVSCSFECGKYINKKEYPAIKQAVAEYKATHSESCEYKCWDTVWPQCKEGRCVPAECEKEKSYSGRECQCPSGINKQKNNTGSWRCSNSNKPMPDDPLMEPRMNSGKHH